MCSINRSNKRYFKWETLWLVWKFKFGVFSAPSLAPSYFNKFLKNEFRRYLFKLIPVRSSECSIRGMQNVLFFKTRYKFFKKYFFLSAITQWNNLELNIRNTKSFNIFRNSIVKFLTPSANSAFNSHNPKAIKFMIILKLVLSHLREHKFKHSFQDLLNPISNYGFDIESPLPHVQYRKTCPP